MQAEGTSRSGHWRNPLLSALLYGLMYFFPLVIPNFTFLLPLLYQFENRPGTFSVRLKQGMLFGCVGSMLGLHWMYTMMEISWLAFPLYLAMSVGFGALMAGAIVTACWLRARTGLTWGILLPVCWLPMDWAKTFGDLRIAADQLGHSLGTVPFLAQFLDLTGLYGATALLLAVNGLLFDIFLAKRTRPRGKVAVVLIVLLVAVLGYDLWAWNRYGSSERSIRVGIVQPNISLETKWNSRVTARAQWDILQKGTETAVLQGAELVVWPETAHPQQLSHLVSIPETWGIPALQDLALRLKTPLLTGVEYKRYEDPEKGEFYNAAVAVHQDGSLDPVWTAKAFLVPFTEKPPFESIFLPLVEFFAASSEDAHWMTGGFTPGPRGRVLPFAVGNAGVTVCYEQLFPVLARELRNAGSDFQVVITNDAWFGRSLFQGYLVNALRLRSIENRTSYVRAANTGISGFFDRRGGATRLTRLFEEQVITGDIALSEGPTLYNRIGDWPVWLALALLAALIMQAKFLPSKLGIVASNSGRHKE
jgi:apolipoprotein N-acyltransferase